jgi:quinohemoprotein ethanol dehydrogenase
VFNAAITYELDGDQYIALAVGGLGRGGYYAPNGARMLVFKLGGTAVLPDLLPYQQPDFVQVEQSASAEVVARGGEVFADNCALCHGQGGAARATFPDLRRSQMLVNQAAFDGVVLKGVLSSRGMGSFAGRLQPPDTEALRAYLIAQAEAARNAPPPNTTLPAPAAQIHASDGRAGGESSPRTRK